jgi:small subunit ribosomal protein S3
MGRKVHPIGMRLKINRDWDARWYAEGPRYVELLQEDFKLRKIVKERMAQAGVSRVEIERQPNVVSINIHASRPGLVIGKKGEGIKVLRQDLEKLTGKTVKVDVTEIEKPDMDATLVAESIAQQLEKRIGYSRAMKKAVQQAMRMGAEGIRIEVSGRLGGSDMSRREWISEGRVPRNTLRASIEFGMAEATTTYGQIGVKVWVYKGVVYGDMHREASRAAQPQDVYTS